jgi:DNA-binding transcriptional LysR family regulator
MMDIRVLYTIVAIAEHGSFLAASRALNLSPAAVSLHVKIIEDELGETLFDWSVRPPVLTDAGRRTLERARRVLEEWERLGDSAPSDVTGVLALGVMPTAVAGLLAPALRRLRELRPQLRVTVTTDDAEAPEERLARGMVDAALTIQSTSPPFGMRFTPVRAETFEVVAPAAVAGDDDAAILSELPFIRFRRHAWITHAIDQELSRRRLRLHASMEVDTLTGVLAMVREGLGASVLPASQLQGQDARPLKRVSFGQPVLSRVIGVLMRPDTPKSPQVEEFLAALGAVVAGSAHEREDESVEGGRGDGETGEKAQVDT